MKVDFPFNYQLRIYFSRLEKREGICSIIENQEDKHALLWDFDDAGVKDIEVDLLAVQALYALPAIHIVSSSPSKYHAYCFVARSFREVIHILSASQLIDTKYLRLGIARGYFTLRISTRSGDELKVVKSLYSDIPREVNPLDLMTDEYLTSNKGRVKNAERT